MSGLEVPALIAGVVGAASATAAIFKKSGGEQSLYKSDRTVRSGSTVERTTDVVFTSGTGRAGISRNGDMVASSSGSGSSAIAYSKWDRDTTWKK